MCAGEGAGRVTAVVTGRLGDRVEAIDLFAGWGGSSQGIRAAGAEVRLAANHDRLAIDCHSANFPDTDHCRADLSDPESADYLDPADLPPSAFLWASPSCRFHSPANARKVYAEGPQARLFADGEGFDEEAYANSERSRVTMLCPLRYAARHRPEIVVVENVVEVTLWGPARDGSTFRWWLAEWQTLGYEARPLFLNSMHFPPCPQSRDRVYVVLWRRGNRAPDLDHRPPALCCSEVCGGSMVEAVQTWKPHTQAWPLERWGKYRSQYRYSCPRCRSPVEPVAWPAYTAIDWSHLGPTIGERRAALAPATLERIRRGLTRFRGGPGVLIPLRGHSGPQPVQGQTPTVVASTPGIGLASAAVVPNRTGGRGWPVDGPTPTLVAGVQSLGLATCGPVVFVHAPFAPFVAALRGRSETSGLAEVSAGALSTVSAGGEHHALLSPMWAKSTITARDTTGLVVLPWIDDYRSSPAAVTEQLATVMSRARQALASIEPSEEPITDEDLERVRFRMLEPDPELRRAMAFGDDYTLLGNKTQRTAGLGNAVTPPVAAWITERCLATLQGGA